MTKEIKKIQSRGWVFTAPADGEYKVSQSDLEEGLKTYSWVAKKERGESGYLHWQGYLEGKTPIANTTLYNKFPYVNFDVRRGTKQQAFDYVVKDETSVGELPIGNMDRPQDDKRRGRGKILEDLRKEMLEDGKKLSDIILENPDASSHIRYLEALDSAHKAKQAQGRLRKDLKVTFMYGKSGVGKTRSIYEKYDFEDVYVVSDYAHPWDSYDGQKILVLDEFDGQIDYSFLLKLLDVYPCQMPARYRNRWADFSEVYIISNLRLDDVYKDEQQKPERWKALLRRIHIYEEMLPGGRLVARSKPGEEKPSKAVSALSDMEDKAFHAELC